MSNANVQSIQAVSDFQQYMHVFRRSLLKEIETLESELSKVTAWISEDAREYWHRERQVIARKLSEHEQQLSRCMASVRENEQRPCTEEKKRVARARERLELCEAKIRAAQTAVSHWEKSLQKIRTRIEHCRDLVNSDLSVADTQLLRNLDALQSYAQMGRPSQIAGGSPMKPSVPANDLREDSAVTQPEPGQLNSCDATSSQTEARASRTDRPEANE
jgi:chromosome segregation ATPase